MRVVLLLGVLSVAGVGGYVLLSGHGRAGPGDRGPPADTGPMTRADASPPADPGPVTTATFDPAAWCPCGAARAGTHACPLEGAAPCDLCGLPCAADAAAAHRAEHPRAGGSGPPACPEPGQCYRYDCGERLDVRPGEDDAAARARHDRELHAGLACRRCALDFGPDQARHDAHAIWHQSRAFRPVPAACRQCGAKGAVQPVTTVPGNYACMQCRARN